jgi:hypothetical protein
MPVVLRSLRDVSRAWEIVFGADGPGQKLLDQPHAYLPEGWIAEAVMKLRRVTGEVVELAPAKHVVEQLPRPHADHLHVAALRETVQFVEALAFVREMQRRVIGLDVGQPAEPRFGVDTAELRGWIVITN